MSQAIEVECRPGDLQVFGMKRSGHHSVIEWLIAQLGGSVLHLNNCVMRDGKLFIANAGEAIQHGSGGSETRLLSFEDQPINRENSLLALGRGLAAPARRVLVLRDPLNTFASRLHKKRNPEQIFWNQIWDNYLDTGLWKEYAREFSGETRHLGEGTLKVNFNRWFCDPEYRRAIASTFGGTGERPHESIPDFGGGSSFDRFSFQGRASEMRVQDRWKRYSQDAEYFEKVLGDPELMEMCRELFGLAPPSRRAYLI